MLLTFLANEKFENRTGLNRNGMGRCEDLEFTGSHVDIERPVEHSIWSVECSFKYGDKKLKMDLEASAHRQHEVMI